jgi:hypothetical protein
MKIPERYLDQHFDRLITIALSLLRESDVQNLIYGDISDELLQNAKDLVNTTLARLLNANTASPVSDAAWTAFLYRALSLDARSLRRSLVKKKKKTVRIDARPVLARSGDRSGRAEPFDSQRPKDFVGEELHSRVVAEADANICKLMKEGFITVGEGAEDFRLIVRNFLANPEMDFTKHLYEVVGHREKPLNRKTANRWWRRVRSDLANQFEPILRPSRGARLR